MKKLLFTLALAGILFSSLSSFGSAPAATAAASVSGKEGSEQSFTAHLAYKGAEILMWTFAGTFLVKFAANEFNNSGRVHSGSTPSTKSNNSSDSQGSNNSSNIQITRSKTSLSNIIGEKPEEWNLLIDMINDPEKYQKRNAELP